MFQNDIIMRQIQQLLAAILKRVAETLQIPTIGELANVLEELSGLRMDEMEQADVNTLAYLLKLRCGNELREPLGQTLRLLATASENEGGEGDHWRKVADALES